MKIPRHCTTQRRRRVMPAGYGRCAVCWITCVVLVLLSVKLSAQAKPTQYQVEAAYLFNFGKFVTFPPHRAAEGANFLICVLGEDPFGPVLDRTIAGESINGKPVADRRILHMQEVSGCSILFISASEAARLSRILAEVKDLPILTVSDIPGFTDRGGMIQFVVQDNRVRFEVNLAPTEQDGLVLSSDLLKVATSVKRRQEGR